VNGTTYEYIGQELDLFLGARNWKRYWASVIRPYVSGDVLEVGAGLGANLGYLGNPAVRSLHCLEPDEALAGRLRDIAHDTPGVTVSTGTVADLPRGSFDAVLYIDVLEHIEDDKGQLATAAGLLRPGGRLIVLAPAHQALFSAFDTAIGHFRRYDRRSLAACTPAPARLEILWYLDSAGLLVSAANRLLLRQSLPTRSQVGFWDSYIVPVSRWLDPLSGHALGKSILAVWRNGDAIAGA
jgi:SAM-dependent methyltransferase